MNKHTYSHKIHYSDTLTISVLNKEQTAEGNKKNERQHTLILCCCFYFLAESKNSNEISKTNKRNESTFAAASWSAHTRSDRLCLTIAESELQQLVNTRFFSFRLFLCCFLLFTCVRSTVHQTRCLLNSSKVCGACNDDILFTA